MWKSKILKAINKQIKQKKQVESSTPLLTESINDKQIQQVLVDDAADHFGKELLENIKGQYEERQFNKNSGSAYHFIDQRGIVGFAIDAKKYDHSFEDWRHFQIYCSQKIMDIGYVMRVKQIESKTQMGNLTSTYRYYLKPSIKGMKSLPMDQLYGNVSIELVLQNSEVFRYIFRTNYYSDRNYQEVKDFGELLHLISQ